MLSVIRCRHFLSTSHLTLVPFILLLLIVTVSRTQAEPAVSALNAKIETAGGNLDDNGAGVAGLVIAAPLGEYLGVQLDSAAGRTDGKSIFAYGFHGFWRNPEQGLLGVTASRLGYHGNYVNRYGAEGEYYTDNWTVSANSGKQTGFLGSTWFARTDIRYYLNDDLVLEGGISGFSDERLAHVGVEWRPEMFSQFPGLSLYADGATGSNDIDYLLGEIRIYFGGGSKSLKQRHREDDPVNSAMWDSIALTGYVDNESDGQGAGCSAGFSDVNGHCVADETPPPPPTCPPGFILDPISGLCIPR